MLVPLFFPLHKDPDVSHNIVAMVCICWLMNRFAGKVKPADKNRYSFSRHSLGGSSFCQGDTWRLERSSTFQSYGGWSGMDDTAFDN